jgi:23S rRNA pseudouridine955/2504/2580 synthase/23S rRNA pseudouridine1911/1915/1917 synthase
VIVHGEFPLEYTAEGLIEDDIYSSVKKKKLFVEKSGLDHSDKRYARTEFKRVKRGNGLNLILASLFTGRIHQIRATLRSIGFPVLGDKLYGLDENFYIRFIEDRLSGDDTRKLLIKRQALHSTKLSFICPIGRTFVEFNSPLPDELNVV